MITVEVPIAYKTFVIYLYAMCGKQSITRHDEGHRVPNGYVAMCFNQNLGF